MTELKAIRLADLPAVVKIMNESSADHSFAFHLDFAGYLSLSRFWNFSYDSSYLACAGSRPAGVLLNCVDRRGAEALSYYWGVLPEFRNGTLSMRLGYSYLGEMKRRGIRKTYGVASLDSPLAIYRKLGYREHQRLVELRTDTTPPGNGDGVTHLDIAAIFDFQQRCQVWERPWVARASFLESAAPFLEITGIRHSEHLVAWMAVTRVTGETSIVALEFEPQAEWAAQRLLAHLAKYPAPLCATHVVTGSLADRLLRGNGFAAGAERVFLVLDLEAYSPKRRFEL